MPVSPCVCCGGPCERCGAAFSPQPDATVSGATSLACGSDGVYTFADPGFVDNDTFCLWSWVLTFIFEGSPFEYQINVSYGLIAPGVFDVELLVGGGDQSYYLADADLECIDGVITGTVVLSATAFCPGAPDITIVFG